MCIRDRLHTVKSVNTKIIWSNTHLLFWLSLTPFGTAYMGENHFSANSVILYAFLQMMNGVAYYILLKSITSSSVSYTHLRAHETVLDLVCRLLLEKKKNTYKKIQKYSKKKNKSHIDNRSS